jgi:hypothetical protein
MTTQDRIQEPIICMLNLIHDHTRNSQDIYGHDLLPKIVRLKSLCNLNVPPSLFAEELMATILGTDISEEIIDHGLTHNMDDFMYNVASILLENRTTINEWIEIIESMYESNLTIHYLKVLIGYIIAFRGVFIDSDEDEESEDEDEDEESENDEDEEDEENLAYNPPRYNYIFDPIFNYDYESPPTYQDSSNDKLLEAGLPLYSEFQLS